MTVLTDTQVITASGGLVELGYSQTTVATTIGTTTTALIPTSGNLTVVCDGSPVLVEVSIPYVTAPTSNNTRIQLVVDGVTNNLGIFSPNTFVPGQFKYRLTPSAGVHTFSVVGYGDVAGTMGAGAATGGGAYVPAFLRVSKIVQATQWPAVTTGTIICTSSTRPASPFVGQQIYEADTNLVYVYSGSAWVKVLQQKSTTTTGWTNATYTNSWASYGGPFSAARYIKDDLGIVHLDGLMAGGTMGASAFTLPAGFRPAYQQIYAAVCNPNAIGRLDILANGQVQPAAGSNVFFSLAGVTFLAEA
jgi:hypothetical protein